MKGLDRPFPIVLAAPSGAGKTSLARALVDRRPDVVFSISATTRPAREYERHGRDYYFVDDAEFDRMIADGELLEWAHVHSRRYGTPVRGVREAVARGETVVLDIDVQGARQIRDRLPEAVLVFVLPPSAEELIRRLKGRDSESPNERLVRMRNAREELRSVDGFDYLVVNDDFDDALAALEAIVVAERHRNTKVAGIDAALAALDAGLGAFIERNGEA